MKISEIQWGDDSAEKDPNLLEYFLESDSLARCKALGKDLIVGRKGAGKSALRQKIKDHFTDTGLRVIEISPSYNSIRNIINDEKIRDGFGREVLFQYSWLKQAYTEALAVVGRSEKGSLSAGSWEFCREIASKNGKTSRDIVEYLSDVITRLRLKVGELGEFGLSIEKEIKEASEVDSLEFHLSEIAGSGVKFIFIFDDLDLGWDNSDLANNLLLGLLASTHHIKARFPSCHSFVCMREDVYSILMTKTQHSDKYRNIERIKWSQEALIKLLEKRINFNRNQHGLATETAAFETVFPSSIGTSNTDNWLVERTLSRPRELIQLARMYSESVDSHAPNQDELKASEEPYSNWKLDDLCSEYTHQYPDLIRIFSYWKSKLFRKKYHLDNVEMKEICSEIYASCEIDKPWFKAIKDEGDLMRIFYEIGFIGDFVIGGDGGSRTFYSHSDQHVPVFREVQIHPCFRKAVRTVDRIRH